MALNEKMSEDSQYMHGFESSQSLSLSAAESPEFLPDSQSMASSLRVRNR
jgi:hypothetical protein